VEWVEWLLSRELRQFVLDHNLFFPLLFVVRVFGVTGLEWLVPARDVRYRAVLPHDIVGAALLAFVMIPAAQQLSGFLLVRPVVPESILALPTAATFLVYYVVGDFGAYWMHRFLHLRPVWRAHKWHHSPTTMYWLAGYRASLLQQVLFNLPWMFAYAVLGLAPWWMYFAVTSSHMLVNDWMHMNVTWRSNWLEWVFVTPRFHHVHHSENPALCDANFGVTFSVWDRLFGTYVDPEKVAQPISFGIGEQVPLARLAVGV